MCSLREGRGVLENGAEMGVFGEVRESSGLRERERESYDDIINT